MQRIEVSELFMKERVRLPTGGLVEHVKLEAIGWSGWLAPELDSFELVDKEGNEFLISRRDVLWSRKKRRKIDAPAAPPEEDAVPTERIKKGGVR